MRALASNGILAEGLPDEWILTGRGALLLGTVPGSLRDLARLFAAPEYLNNPFNAAMSNIAGAVHRAIATVYDFAAIDLLVDVGGGTRHLMAHILERFPEMRAIVL